MKRGKQKNIWLMTRDELRYLYKLRHIYPSFSETDTEIKKDVDPLLPLSSFRHLSSFSFYHLYQKNNTKWVAWIIIK